MPERMHAAFPRGLGLWVTAPIPGLYDTRFTTLCLLEDPRRKDDEVSLSTALSALMNFVWDTTPRPDIPWGEFEPIPEEVRGAAWERSLHGQFASDPVGFLQAHGATVSTERRIETWYRHRFESVNEARTTLEIGYPIWIREA